MTNEELIRKMPVSIEAEQSVLGSILIKPDSFDAIAAILQEDDFYTEEHRHIFAAMRDMFLMSKNVDAVTLVNTLVTQGVYSEEAGYEYMQMIARMVPSAANIKDYATIVHDKAILRRLITACDDIHESAYAEQGEVSAIVDEAAQRMFDIAQNRDSKEFRHIREIIGNVYLSLQELAENKGAITGTRTGFSALDRVLVQMGPGDLVLVGARPGMGKTSFAMNIAVNAAKSTKKAVAVFSLEMTGEQLVNRMLSSEAMVDSYALRSGEIRREDWEKIATATAELSGCDIYIDDTAGLTVTDLKAKLRRIKNLGLVFIDYLQLMQSGRNIENRAQEVGEISRHLKLTAKDLGVPIICCAQLSRANESRTVKKPMLSDLRDSGSIEQDADVVLFLYRDEYYKDQSENNNNEQTNSNQAEVIVAKNRHGSVGSVKMGWIGQYTKFCTLEEDEREGVS